MRIIGGKEGGRFLKVPKGLGVRPTPDLVKQALFNSLGERIIRAKVLELFGGSGALSLESLSRGATGATCVEKSQRHARMIRTNADALGIGHKFELRIQDAFVAVGQLAQAGIKYDVIVADPPYGDKNVGRRSTSFAQKLLDDEHLPLVLTSGGLFILGHSKRDTLELGPRWAETKMLKHGDSLIRFLKYAQTAA
ncbi:MAG: RsmD family RNA methyltransferase [Verrucomicrobiales bacterium]